MDKNQFQSIIKNQVEKCLEVNFKKNEGYALDGDCLGSFKRSAVLQGRTPAQILGGSMAKHTISIYDMLNSNQAFPMEIWEEKIVDHINYLLILKALLVEGELIMVENINHPSHYGGEGNPYEAIKVIDAWGLDFV